ncbi:hypothetical protein L210DRAFT_3535562 [Boletus edulis BED1]|uniref:Uncharacterized protein n=1 Tax=Boletus edulis BED1 TaxID=1328754 RepID=A0AAD4BE76_BOLED|nr:hypothetical protein L210DRAFT_3568588 [Boletus edulis BED1]KAF8443324.1 hypothetical protein L210DRAFT_3535562 [Boletus edulis BED1]
MFAHTPRRSSLTSHNHHNRLTVSGGSAASNSHEGEVYAVRERCQVFWDVTVSVRNQGECDRT